MIYGDERDLETDDERARREREDAMVARGGMRPPRHTGYCRKCGKPTTATWCNDCYPPLTDADLDNVPF
jgi:hypothetical protein